MRPSVFNSKNSVYSTRAVAKLLGVTERRVQQLTKDGVIPAVTTGAGYGYELAPAVQAYIAYLRAGSQSNSGQLEQALKRQKMEADIALKESQGELQRLKMDITAGKYITVEEARLDYARFFVAFKKFALALPGRLVSQLGGTVEPLEARRIEKELLADITKALRSFVVAGVEEENGIE